MPLKIKVKLTFASLQFDESPVEDIIFADDTKHYFSNSDYDIAFFPMLCPGVNYKLHLFISFRNLIA